VREDRRQRAPLILTRNVGVLLACFAIDYRVLFEPLTEEIVQDGFQYYRTFYNAPLGIKVRFAAAFSCSQNKNAEEPFNYTGSCVVCVRASLDRRCFMVSLPWE
jgi:hypothetical protein